MSKNVEMLERVARIDDRTILLCKKVDELRDQIASLDKKVRNDIKHQQERIDYLNSQIERIDREVVSLKTPHDLAWKIIPSLVGSAVGAFLAFVFSLVLNII